jgi:hypothetical protein
MPQLDFVSYPSQMVWVLFLFVILFVCVTQGLLPLLRRIFWFREFKKLNFIADSRIVNNSVLGLFIIRNLLINFFSFCSVFSFYMNGLTIKKSVFINRVWLR